MFALNTQGDVMKRVMWVVWPAFLMAGLIEVLVFAFVDPQDLQFVVTMQLSRNTTYSVAFLVIWAVVSLSSALTLLLANPPTDHAPDASASDGSGTHRTA
jgi:hypothetical protein